MNYLIHSHNHGEASLPANIVEPVKGFVSDTKFKFQPRSASHLRDLILSFLQRQGWSEEVRIAPQTRLTVTSIKQSVALALQTGNVGRFYADLLKLQYLYTQNRVDAAIYLLPTKEAAKSMGSNIANFERLVEELQMFRHIVTIPILVIGLKG